ncbi:MAG TPA: DUF935 family protein [Candidatus Kapabacteria bacterium]|nr:DUF935 family protein [Candidatus Kapabacteria bacterium]
MLGDARRAVQKADRPGDLRDTRELMAILERISQASPRIVGDLATRRAALAGFGWHIAARDPRDTDRATQAEARLSRLIQWIRRWWWSVPWYGAGCVEIEWRPLASGAGLQPVVVKSYRPTEIERNGPDPQAINLLADTPLLVRLPITAKVENSMLAACDGFHQAGGLGRTLLWHDLLRNDALQEQVAFLRMVKGLAVGQYEEWSSDEAKKALEEALANLTKHQYAKLPKDISFQYQQMVNSMGATSFREFIDSVEEACSIVILGQANTTKLPNNGGSRAAVQVSNLIRTDILFYDISGCDQLINEQILLFDARMNISPALDESPFVFSTAIEEDEDPEVNMRVIADALAAGLPVIANDAYRQIGLTRPDGVPDIIEPATKPAVPGF